MVLNNTNAPMALDKLNDSTKLKKINVANPDVNMAMVMGCVCGCPCKTDSSYSNAQGAGYGAVSHFN